MKKVKKSKWLWLLFAVIYSLPIMTSFTVFAANTNGNTEVVARIETAPTDSTQSVTDNTGNSVPTDDKDILTGDTTSGYIIVVLILLIILASVIYLLNKNNTYEESA